MSTSQIAADLSITDRLTLIGIRHERDDHSVTDGGHRLYRGEEYIGRFTAFEACALLSDAQPA